MEKHLTTSAQKFIDNYCHKTTTTITKYVSSTLPGVNHILEENTTIEYHRKLYSIADSDGRALDLYEYDLGEHGKFREVIQFQYNETYCTALVPWAATNHGSPDFWFSYCPDCHRPYDEGLSLCVCNKENE